VARCSVNVDNMDLMFIRPGPELALRVNPERPVEHFMIHHKRDPRRNGIRTLGVGARGNISDESAVQTTWLALAENAHQIRCPERLEGWLVTTARRACLHILRHAKPVLDHYGALAETVSGRSALSNTSSTPTSRGYYGGSSASCRRASRLCRGRCSPTNLGIIPRSHTSPE
jgi:hypothetical protein